MRGNVASRPARNVSSRLAAHGHVPRAHFKGLRWRAPPLFTIKHATSTIFSLVSK